MLELVLVYKVGDDVMVIVECRREGLWGLVVQETAAMVVLVDDAGFLHWLPIADMIHTFGL
jgi:RNase P/RNase MRP subunit p29